METRGRKSKYETHIKPYLDEIKKLRQSGYLEEQICEKYGIGVSTFQDYKKLYPELVLALKIGRDELVLELEDTLYRKALGKCKIKETKKYIESNDGVEKTRIEETIKEIAPDTTALIFSLKNLLPNKFKDVQDVTFNDMEVAMHNMDSVFNELKDKLPHEIKSEPEVK